METPDSYAEFQDLPPRGGDGGIRIAVLDGPVDLSHPCFAGARLTQLQTLAHETGTGRARAHGTHVASVIFGQPGSPVRGVAPGCSGLIAPIFSDGERGLTCSQLDLARAILLAVEHGAHIINISGGEFTTDGEADGFLRDALAHCEAQNVLVVAAAGNDGCDCVHMPAAIATALAVGAAGLDGRPLPFSNWGAAYRANGILAPGEAIEGAAPGGGTARRTGSSFAAPIVSGLAGLMLAEQCARGEQPSPLEVRQALIGTAIECEPRDHERCLAGRLNLHGASQELNGGRRAMSIAATAHENGQAGGNDVPAAGIGAAVAEIAAAASIDGGTPQVQGGDTGLRLSDCGCGGEGGTKKDCGCGCGGAAKAAPQLVYALGQIGYDFGTEARRDSIRQFMDTKLKMTTEDLIRHLNDPENIEDVERVIWTLNLDSTPIYALAPSGAFATEAYERIFTAFSDQVIGQEVERKKKKAIKQTTLFAVPGRVSGSIRLMSGETVPVLVPAGRGMVGWDVDAALDKFLEDYLKAKDDGLTDAMRKENAERMEESLPEFLRDFRNLITRKYRNLGILGRERALNYASTAAFRAFDVLKEIGDLDLIIDDVVVVKSSVCRASSECYDVQIRVFRQSDTTAALRVFQFTLDVSDTIPVSIGDISIWRERPKD